MTDVSIPHKKITAFGRALFHAVSVASWHSEPVVDGLVETSLSGVDSHGIRLLPHYVRAVMVGRINKRPRFKYKKNSPSVGILDADHGFGIAAGVIAMDHAIDLAKTTGVGAISVRYSSHFGAAAIFALRAARKNMIGIAFTDVDSLVFPYGGKKTYFGTNPICFAAPMEGEEPWCLDMATSRIPLNKILAYRAAKKSLETGWGADKSGNPTTDPEKAVSPLSIGDYKGYGLAMMVAILSSLLAGMPFGQQITPMYPLDGRRRNLGHFFMAMNISSFRSIKGFKRDLSQMVRELRSITPRDAGSPVIVPRDPEKAKYILRLKNGIPVPMNDLESYRQLAIELGIDSSHYLGV